MTAGMFEGIGTVGRSVETLRAAGGNGADMVGVVLVGVVFMFCGTAMPAKTMC